MRVGDPVILNVPDNPRLHRQPALITVVTDWGAHLHCPAAATGCFRALPVEMLQQAVRLPNTAGCTGDVCAVCQGCNLVRTGTCVTCQDCGNNEGCG